METKEAIKAIKKQKLRTNAINTDIFGIKGIEGYNKMSDDIIELLKRGEAYEKMWKKLKRDNKTVTFFDEMEEVEQKYL